METVSSHPPVAQFQAPRTSLGNLDPATTARILAAAADVALVLDADGIIRDVAVGSHSLSRQQFDLPIGRHFIDTVTVESRGKVQELLEAAAGEAGGVRWRQINHPTPRGVDIPIRYSAFAAGRQGPVIALGRDLSELAALQQRVVEAQLSMEREYSRLRHAETRYRLLFHMASEAVLIVDAGSNRVTDANPAASRVLSLPSGRLVGHPVFNLFDDEGGGVMQALLSSARASGHADGAQLRLGGKPVALAASMFRQEDGAHFLIRIGGGEHFADSDAEMAAARSARVLRDLPEGFVVTTPDRRIATANKAFLDLAQVASPEQVTGQPLEGWLGRSSVDFNVLVANLREHGSVRYFPTIVRGQYGSTEDVEVSAVSVLHGEEPCLGFVIRATARRAPAEPRSSRQLPHSVEQLTELIGKTPLKELVRETTDVIEKLCIEAALQLTGDNRASAAQMLGLSRQSLYVKLRRYGLSDGNDAEEA